MTRFCPQIILEIPDNPPSVFDAIYRGKKGCPSRINKRKAITDLMRRNYYTLRLLLIIKLLLRTVLLSDALRVCCKVLINFANITVQI